MQIVIPTYRRMARQETLKAVPPRWLASTVLVVDQHDADLASLYDLRGAELLVHPPEITTIAAKRAWIIRQREFSKILMLDDDLRFAVRVSEDPANPRLRQATSADMERHLELMHQILDEHAHAGWSARQGNNGQTRQAYGVNCRMMYVLGYDCELLRSLEAQGKIQLGRIQTREDMDLCLQLLRDGWGNHVRYDICADQAGGFAAKGGCSEERTLESSDRDADRLAELHPGLVKVVQKEYQGSMHRREVVVQWKKAYQPRGGVL